MNNKVVAIITLVALFSPIYGQAQEEWEKGFEEFRQSAKDEYEFFRKSTNDRFARDITKTWTKHSLSSQERREIQEPDSPSAIRPSDSIYESSEINVDDVELRHQCRTAPFETDVCFTTTTIITSSKGRNVSFNFYGKPVNITVPEEYGSFHPDGINETSVGNFWKRLSECNYNIITGHFLKYRFDLNLNDWGTYKWICRLSEAIFPNDVNSERSVFTVFILNQAGLLANVARVGDRLECIFASSEQIYAKPFTMIGEQKFYIGGDVVNTEEIYTYNIEPCRNLRPLDLNIYNPVKLGGTDEEKNGTMHSGILSTDISVPVSDGLLSFYGDYPQTDINVYAAAAPNEAFARAIKDCLKPAVQGMSNVEALNLLLRFLQKDFSYRTDGEQFGKEKPFFCEENFYYAANDCEDRSILFCFLVKELLNLDYMLLQYSDHIDCAVCLEDDIKGYYVNRSGRKYYICDPTLIGGSVGMSGKKREKPEKIWLF